MNKKIVYFAMALLSAACSSTVESLDQERAADSAGGNGEIGFSAYMNRVTTRSGSPGTLTKDESGDGKVALQTAGFGVTAFHTVDALYAPNSRPDFMYNQKVTYLSDAGVWDYYPMMYWPNQRGDNGSESTDRLSFFAYAPWVDVDVKTGKVTGDDESGIVSMTSNTAVGDPAVRYVASLKPDRRVDFCWAAPQIDKVRPENTTEKVAMRFNHALSSLNLMIDAYVDKSDNSNPLPGETRVWVRSVTFEGFALKGAFSLNQSAADPSGVLWTEPYTSDLVNHDPITVRDGRSDGLEGKSESRNEKPLGLNPVLVQSMTYSDLDGSYESDATSPKRGVYNDIRNLFDVSGAYADGDKPTVDELTGTMQEPVFVIPTDRPLRVTIAYDIETRAANLPGYLSDGVTHGISVSNVISTTVQKDGADLRLEPGKNYTVRLHLGLTGVQYACAVTPWGESVAAEEIDIPIDDLSLNEMMLNVYVNPWQEQDEVLVSVPMSDLQELATYFKAARSGSDDVSGRYVGREIDAQGHIKDMEGSEYSGPSIGRIAYISTNGTDVDSKRPGSRILVIREVNYEGQWSLFNELQGYTDVNAVNGWQFTASHAALNDGNDPATYYYPAAYNVDLLNADSNPAHIAISGAECEWFLPSKQQMMLIGCYDGSATGQANILNMGTGKYWSATEQDASTVRCYVEGRWTVAEKSSSDISSVALFAY